VQQSETTKALFTALAAAQSAVQPAAKDSVNPHFKSKYADLGSIWDAVKPALAANGLSVVQEVVGLDGGVGITTQINHASGEWLRLGPLKVPTDKSNAHGTGSAITYGKRFALAAALGVVAEDDDDGNHASAAASRTRLAEKPADAPRRNGAGPMPAPESVAVLLDLVNKSKDVADLAKNWGVVMQSRGQLNAADLAKLTKAKDAMKSRLAVPAGGDAFEG
jgi:hypothetical protein